MDDSKVLLVVIGSRPSPSAAHLGVISIQELTLSTSRSPLEISHTPILDCLAASGANGLMECEDEGRCMELLTSFASSASNSNEIYTSAEDKGDEMQQIIKAMEGLLSDDQGGRARIVHLKHHPYDDQTDRAFTFVNYVNALRDEVVYLEKVDKAILSAVDLIIKGIEGKAENLLIGALYLGPSISSVPYSSSSIEPVPICLAKANFLIKSLGGAEVVMGRVQNSSKKPKAKRAPPSSSSPATIPPIALNPSRALLSELHAKADFNDARRRASWAGRQFIQGLPREVFGPYSEPWPDPFEVRGDAVRSFDELSAARGVLGRFMVERLVEVLQEFLA